MSTSASSTYVQNLYKAILQRTGDTSGIDYWVARADSGLSAADMTNIFIGSPETKNVIAVLHLYDVFFNRAPDSAGLGYWVNALNSGTSLLDIAKGFSAASEFQAKFAIASTADYVEATYSNIFDRSSDAAGKAYWMQEIDSGKLSRAEVGLTFTLSSEAHMSTGAATRFAESYLVLRASGIAEPTTSSVETLATKPLAVALAEKITGYDVATGFTVSGKIVDGYLTGATVFADANGDGIWNIGEATAITDAKGNFSIDDAKGALVASGGIDLSTGKAFKGVLKAPEGSTMVNPLTSLQQAFVEKGLSLADAELKVAKALGLDASKFDLTTYDPLAASLDADASASDRALGAQLQAQAANIANLLVAAGQTLIGAAGGADKLDATTASNSLLDAMINAISSDSDGVVSFSDKAMLESVINDAVKLSGDADLVAAGSKVVGMASAFAAMSAASADNVDKAVAAGGDVNAMIAKIAQSSVIAQGAMADQMQAAAANGNLSAMQSNFTGTAFDVAANKAVIGDLNPNSTTDDAAVAASNAGAGTPSVPVVPAGGGSGPTPTGQGSRTFPAANETAYSDVINANQSSITTSAKTFNASNGNDEYLINADAATHAANIRISGFGSGDKLLFSAPLTASLSTLDTLYTIADNGTDVSLYANIAGNVQYITLAGLSGSRAVVGGGIDSVSELASFLGAGAITLINNASTTDETSGSDVINANQMNILSTAKVFNAANGNDEYVINTDTANRAANIRISGFGSGDKLLFDAPTNATLSTLDTLYTIADNGTDVSLYANTAGNVQYITLVGLAGSRAALGGGIDSVTELATFLGNDAIAFI